MTVCKFWKQGSCRFGGPQYLVSLYHQFVTDGLKTNAGSSIHQIKGVRSQTGAKIRTIKTRTKINIAARTRPRIKTDIVLYKVVLVDIMMVVVITNLVTVVTEISKEVSLFGLLLESFHLR